MERIQIERAQRIEQLLGPFDLLGTCARACAEAGIEGHEQALAYCLVALSDKADPVRSSKGAPARRTYGLDLDADDFAEQLAAWAGEVARNLKRWGPVYTAIQDEADRFEIQTLRRYVRTRHDDVVDCIADTIGVMLAGAPRIHEMTLDAVREEPPGAGAYVFQRPLQRWIGTVARRRTPWNVDPFEEGEDDPSGNPVASDVAPDDVLVDEIVETAQQADDELAALIARIAHLRETRALLADALRRAEAADGVLARIAPADDEDAARLARVRAALLHEADQLRLEQRAVTSMLAYIVLAMRAAPKLQHVAVLSLRDAAIDREAVDDMAARMRALIDDERHPSPRLVFQIEAARALKRSRATALSKLRKAPARRGAELAPVARMLDGLPPTVAGVDGIVGLTTSTASIVTTYRNDTSKELRAVDTIYDRVFRRYAMGDRA